MSRSVLRVRYPHVAVCVDKSRSYGRGVLRGIAEYVETYGRWSLYIDPQAGGNYGKAWLNHWRGDGVLAFVENSALAQRLHRSGIPTVELFGHRLDLNLPQVGNDDVAVGRLAAEHLLERQFTHFAFTGYARELWVERRFRGFAERIRAAGFACAQLRCARQPATPAGWETSQQVLVAWLERLSRPLGLMACSDRHAQRVLDACRRAGLAVPEEIAVIGVDNDEETCRLSDPPLTSVMDDTRRIGFEAARLLDRLMAGHRPSRRGQPILIPPLGIATRRSTEVTAIADRRIAEAMRFIRQHACEGIGVPQLVAELRLSRSELYRRFRQATGRSPAAEVLRVRLERVKSLLSQTQLTLEQIAELTGFAHPEYLSVAFKRETGLVPGQFRKRKGGEGRTS